MGDLETLVTFNASLAKETEARDLQADLLRSGVRAVLEDRGKGWYVVAERGVSGEKKEVVGQLLITFEWSDWRNGNFWWLQSLYVKPLFRGQGVLRSLFQFVEHQVHLQPERVCGFRLYVEHENAKAHNTYAHLGFIHTSYHLYEIDFSELSQCERKT